MQGGENWQWKWLEKDGWVDGWMGGWMGGWVDGLRNGNTGKETIVQLSLALCLPVPSIGSSGFLFPACILVLCCLQNQIPGYLCSSFEE